MTKYNSLFFNQFVHAFRTIFSYMKICRYVFRITHVPRLEDWSVMPVERIGFMLQVCMFLIGYVCLFYLQKN